VTISTLEVTVEGYPDDIGVLGFLGIDESIPAGEHGLKVRYRIGSDDATPEQLHQLAAWVGVHSPVGDSVNRTIPLEGEVDIV
jgi:hypothetical protein